MVAEHYEVIFTAPSAEEASRLGEGAVRARLAACAQVSGPITSVYWWRGEVETATEWRCTLKTTATRVRALLEAIRAGHSYDTPEVIATPIEVGDHVYLRWVSDETAPAGPWHPS